jgi:hypothetical protein
MQAANYTDTHPYCTWIRTHDPNFRAVRTISRVVVQLKHLPLLLAKGNRDEYVHQQVARCPMSLLGLYEIGP